MGNVNASLEEILTLDGALGAALGDWKSGMCLACTDINQSEFTKEQLEIAIAGNTEVIRAKLKVAQALKLNDRIEDILISLNTQYHLMRINQLIPGLFFYLALDKEQGNLAMARFKLIQIEKELVL